MQKKKVILINHYGITPDMPGATRNYDLAKYISENTEYDVEFWRCSVGHYVDKNQSEVNKPKVYMDGKLKINGIRSISYRGNSIRRVLNMVIFDINTALKLLFSKDIKFVLLCVPPINFFNILAMRLRKIKLIVDVEDLWPLFLSDMDINNKAVLGVLRLAANHTYRTASAISAVSEGMLNYVRNEIDTDGKITWLSPLGVDISQYSGISTDTSFFNKYNWADDFVVMYIGAMGPANDLESVLRTIAVYNSLYSSEVRGKKLSFVFIGHGSAKDILETIRTELSLFNVYIEDGIPASLVPQFLVRANICLTNLKQVESFKLVRPNKLFQYMAAKKPILCGIWGEMQSIVEATKAGVYVDFNDYKMAAGLLRDIFERDDLDEMGERGFEYVSLFGDRNLIYKKTVEVLRELE